MSRRAVDLFEGCRAWSVPTRVALLEAEASARSTLKALRRAPPMDAHPIVGTGLWRRVSGDPGYIHIYMAIFLSISI